MEEKVYLAQLKGARILRAEGALQTGAPPPDCAFYLGRECGIQVGLQMAEKILTDMLKTEKEKDT